jgi:site-specific DNA recombinase
MERQAAKTEDHSTRLTTLRAKICDSESRLGRLYSAIESGVADLDDGTLKDRVAAVKTERDLAQIAYDRAVPKQIPAPASRTKRSRSSLRRCAQTS